MKRAGECAAVACFAARRRHGRGPGRSGLEAGGRSISGVGAGRVPNGENIPVTAALLEAGADPAAPDEDGRNPARRATTNDKLPFEAVGLLSARKFPSMKDADDTSP